MHLRRSIVLAAFAALLVAGIGPAQARSDEALPLLAIKAASVGFGGKFKPGYWQPVRLTLVAGSRPVRGKLELVVPDGDQVPVVYGNEQAGAIVWPSLQDTLGLQGLDGIVSYPVKANLDGKTRVVVQYAGDGIVNSHDIYRQLDAVKHQYGCFLATYLRDGVPTVPPPNVLTHPCP